MAPTSSLNMTTGHSNTTTKPHDSEFCPPFPNAYFENLDSSVPYIVNATLNVSMAIATTFTNLLVLLAMRHVTSIRLPSKLLLCSLVLTDLGVGLVVQPQFAALLFMRALNPYRVRCVLVKSYILTWSLFSAVSLMTMTAISLDRYAALFVHLKYQQIVTTRRICAVLTFIWLHSLFFSSSFIWNFALRDILIITGFIICLLVMSVACIKIYRRLRSQHGHQVQPQAHDQAHPEQQAGNTLNMARYKRTASTMMWIYVLFIICYLPFFCSSSIRTATGRVALTGWEFSYTILLLNSCLNPFVYCLRHHEIRTEVMKQFRHLFCRNSQQ